MSEMLRVKYIEKLGAHISRREVMVKAWNGALSAGLVILAGGIADQVIYTGKKDAAIRENVKKTVPQPPRQDLMHARQVIATSRNLSGADEVRQAKAVVAQNTVSVDEQKKALKKQGIARRNIIDTSAVASGVNGVFWSFLRRGNHKSKLAVLNEILAEQEERLVTDSEVDPKHFSLVSRKELEADEEKLSLA